MLEDYRAGLTVDRAAEEADRAAGRRVACPTLVLRSAPALLQGPAASLREAGGRRVLLLRGGGRIDSGHHMAEEAPEELVAALVPFVAG
jgi:haloacetate dehalogenase